MTVCAAVCQLSFMSLKNSPVTWCQQSSGRFLRQQRDFTDNSVRLKNLRHLRQLRLTKTDIHPLKSMGRCPAAMLPLWLYKSKLLTSKRKPASTFLQKAYIIFKAINRKSTFCWKNAVHKLCTPSKEMFIYCLQPCCCRYNEIVMR